MIIIAISVSSFVSTKVFCHKNYKLQADNSQSDMIITPFHSAAMDLRNYPQMLSCIQLWFDSPSVSMGKIRIQGKYLLEKRINSQCNFLNSTSSCTSMWFSRHKTVCYIFLIFRSVKQHKNFDQIPLLQNQQNMKTPVKYEVQTMSSFF